MGKMISVGEAAQIKNLHPQSIRDAIKAGRLKGYKSGKFYLVDLEDLEKYEVIGHRPKKKTGRAGEGETDHSV